MAEEIRAEQQPAMTSAIGFALPDQPGQARRVVVKRIVNMLDEGAVASVADFSVFLLNRHNREV
ncbi:MAG TPA: hypothetical protein VFU69_02905 [Ktedonobacterales bacterium]|nr:hypothetical protein [Ktedonobacterales bacterium]